MVRSVKEVRPDDKPDEDFYISLAKLVGPVKDIRVHMSREFGDVSLVLSQIILEDGRTFSCEGEHDFPYLADYSDILDIDELEAMYHEENPDDEE
jgi:hypothetical protein